MNTKIFDYIIFSYVATSVLLKKKPKKPWVGQPQLRAENHEFQLVLQNKTKASQSHQLFLQDLAHLLAQVS